MHATSPPTSPSHPSPYESMCFSVVASLTPCPDTSSFCWQERTSKWFSLFVYASYSVCPHPVGTFDYMVHICSRTPCLQTRLVKRRSRKCTDVTRGQSQFGFSCRQASRWPEDLCWCPWRPAIKHESTHPGLVPGTRLRIAHASSPRNSGPAQLAAGYIYIYAPWPAGPPHAHRKFACLWLFVVCLCSL